MEITTTHYGNSFAIITGISYWEPSEEEVTQFVLDTVFTDEAISVDIWAWYDDWGFEVVVSIA